MKAKSIAAILTARKQFRENPRAEMRVDWATVWSREDFDRWLIGCIQAKINGHDGRECWRKMQPEYQSLQRRDGRKVNDAARRIRHSGSNLLATPEMKRRFPLVDNPPRDY